jgi:hypothetical protein
MSRSASGFRGDATSRGRGRHEPAARKLTTYGT